MATSSASGSRRTTTRCSASRRTPPTPRSRRPTAGWRRSTTRMRTRATRRRGSVQGDLGCLRRRRRRGERPRYDQVRDMAASGFGGGCPVGSPGGGFPGGGTGAVRGPSATSADLGTCSAGWFGGGRRGRSRSRTVHGGRSPRPTSPVTFEQAMTGTAVPVKIQGPAPCSSCGGTGALRLTVTCRSCGGSGEISVKPGLLPDGAAVSALPRDRRAGRAGVSHLSGLGLRAPHARSFQVKVPPGVKDGARIKLSGTRRPGRPGAPAETSTSGCTCVPTRSSDGGATDLTVDVPVTYRRRRSGRASRSRRSTGR